jgi:hypothetical protein
MANNARLYSRAAVEEVLRLTNIMDVVNPHTELRPQGNGEWSGLCPFHKEKTPSFYVNEAKGVYICYGCQKKGNAITFLKEMDGLTFSEAMSRLRRNAGLPDVGMDARLEDISVRRRSMDRNMDSDEPTYDVDPVIDGYSLGDVMFQLANTGRFVLESTDNFDAVEEVYRRYDDAVRDEDWEFIANHRLSLAQSFEGVEDAHD